MQELRKRKKLDNSNVENKTEKKNIQRVSTLQKKYLLEILELMNDLQKKSLSE